MDGLLRRCFGPPATGDAGLWPRWIFLRALGVIFGSQFFSMAYEIHGLIGEHGILPARDYLDAVGRVLDPLARAWQAPTVLWFGAGDTALWLLVVAGLCASAALVLNLWPRAAIAVAWVMFVSFIGAAQEFASYQSDGMLVEAGFAAFFFAPRGFRPGLGASSPPSWASRFLLLFEWFRIYFESGVAKLASGEPAWRQLTALDHYYENGPLPTWIGWYAQHLPHWFHAACAAIVLLLELVVVWMMFLPRRARIVCFCIVTPFQAGIILTANYTFLNYLVLFLGVLLLDDRALRRPIAPAPAPMSTWRIAAVALVQGWVFCAQLVLFRPIWAHVRDLPRALTWPVRVLQPVRLANAYGLFAVMTDPRYEIEFQGTRDGVTWTPYPFRFKPQAVDEAPGIYAPYQPRFEWNLWFASLEPWDANPWLGRVQAALLVNDPTVLGLFARNPFAGAPPTRVRLVKWRYWFTDLDEKRKTGAWWNREVVDTIE